MWMMILPLDTRLMCAWASELLEGNCSSPTVRGFVVAA